MSEYTLAHTENERRLFEMLPAWALLVDTESVTLDDLLSSRPGTIVRLRGRPQDCIQLLVPPGNETLGCVAGWISEEEQ